MLFKLALALHMSLRFAEANETYQRAFEQLDAARAARTAPTRRCGSRSSFLPNDPDPRSAIAWPNIQLCMQLFDRLVEQWPERTIVPSLAERWEIADDGLRYVFHLREGLTWSDGAPLTAHDVEFGIKRVLEPRSRPGRRSRSTSCWRTARTTTCGRNDDADAIGVRALDDRTVEFRLAAPAPYFMSVMNRPDGGPQPRHAIEAAGDGVDRGRHAGGERRVPGRRERTTSRSCSSGAERRAAAARQRRAASSRALAGRRCARGRTSAASSTWSRCGTRRGSPTWCRPTCRTRESGPAAWSGYLAFDHAHPDTSNVDLRRALAHAVDRERLAAALPVNMVVATGGVVPPALQGHTPDIALRFDPDLARWHLERAGPDRSAHGWPCLEDEPAR